MPRYLYTLFILIVCSCALPTAAQLPAYVPTPNLILFYGFHGTANDLSVNGIHGILSGPSYVSDRFGYSSSALYYSGTSERIITHKIDRTTTNSFSYSVWVKPLDTAFIPTEGSNGGLTTNSSYSCIIAATDGANWASSSPDVGVGLNVATNGIYVVEHGSAITDVSLAWSGTLTGWHHIVIVYASGTPKLYIDGTYAATGINFGRTKHPSLGCDSFYSGSTVPYVSAGFGHGLYPIVVPSYNFHGYLDDIAIYGRAITPCEITQLYDTVTSIAAITGSSTIHPCDTTTLHCATLYGTWTSSNTSVAAINPTSGLMTGGTSTGVATISYTATSGCVATKTVTCAAHPPISGTSSFCAGVTTTFSHPISGGRWSSSGPAVATIDSITGVVHGVAGGFCTIVYVLPNGCTVTFGLTILSTPTPIYGPNHVCVGSSITLTDTSAGGTWSITSGSGSVYITPYSGLVVGASPGVVIISYDFSSGCSTSFTLTVDPSPAAIVGSSTVCVGFTTTLTDATSGGVWLSSNPSVATIDLYTGLVTGITVGTAVITYTAPGGCIAVKNLTVSALPPPIIGPSNVCAGQIIVLSTGTPGTWSSSNTAIATIGSTSGVLTGVSPGTVTISIALASGCTASTSVTVNPQPSPITGASSICSGTSTTLTNATSGGTWTSSNPAVATIGSASGIVNGISFGSVTISYTLPTGCYITATFVVNALPTPIIGTGAVCLGGTSTLYGAGTGTWSSSSTTVATVGVGSGIVTGLSVGSTIITFTLPTGCSTSTVFTVNPNPAPIAGTSVICQGYTTTFSDITPGGAWSSSNPVIGSISSLGVITGITGGNITITYMLPTGCMVTKGATINPTPAPISGSSTVCTGHTITLSDPLTGGTWYSSNPATGTIGSLTGVFYGIAPGTTTITYTLPTGCYITTTITVYPNPSPITGTSFMCTGASLTLYDATTGGYWSSSDITIADPDSYTGLVYGYSSGTAIITYSTGPGCITTYPVTVNPLPGPITGSGSLCVGTTTTLFCSGGGTWTISPSTVATINPTTGLVTGITTGTASITYTLPTGCSVTSSIIITAGPLPIVGASAICLGLTTPFTDPMPGGSWSSSNPLIAAVSSTSGVVTGMGIGSAIITYTIGSGCYVTKSITINGSPGTITGTMHLCTGGTTTLTNAITGGTWSISPVTTATINPTTGVVSGLSAGIATVTYSLGGAGCNTTATVTVDPLPGAITGTPLVCVGATTSLTAPGGGTWTSSTASIATVGLSSGVVTGISTGTATITFSLATGCYRTQMVTVNPLPPLVLVTGGGGFCVGGSGLPVGLSSSTAGITYQLYLGSTPLGTPVMGTGSAISFGIFTTPGFYTVSATNTTTGCSRNMAGSASISVNPLPTIFTVSGGGSYCAGGTGLHINLSGSNFGVSYKLYNGPVLVMVIPGTGSPLDFGLQTTPGTYTVVATNNTTLCSNNMFGSAVIIINPLPSFITGPTAVCVGSSITLSDSVSGGTWSSSNPLIAGVISSTGVVTGMAIGAATITYSLTTGCYRTMVVNVTSLPLPIAGSSSVCVGNTTTLTDVIAGGSWTSSAAGVASIGLYSGIVTGVTSGTAIITYSLGTGCSVTRSITVLSGPAAIAGSSSICVGTTTAFTDPTIGGTWSSSASTIASISTSGIVSGIATGTATIDYTIGGCSASRTITISPTPSAIAGPSVVCIGSTITKTNSISGGTWSTSSPFFSIGSGTGLVTAISAGTGTITYSIGSCNATAAITVNPSPLISGSTGLCTGSSSTLSASISGGTWSSSNPSIVSVIATTGLVTGVALGTATITYSIPAGCSKTVVVSVNSAPAPIGGPTHICVGATSTLTNSTGGGTWTISPATIATVSPTSGLVSGINAGIATVTYSLGSGCTTTSLLTINAIPAAIAGPSQICLGTGATMTDASPGGLWFSSTPAVAPIVMTSGVVASVATGTTTISYTVAGCSATKIVTVNPLPSAISGSSAVCTGENIILTNASAGGRWTSSSPATAGIDTLSGLVSGISTGTATITFTLPTGCISTRSITVNATPAPITGGSAMCVGNTIALSDATVGGLWSSSSVSIAPVSGVGVVTGLAIGTVTISYTIAGCSVFKGVTVNSVPPSITGPSSVCIGTTITKANASPGGIWSSSNPSVAIIGTSSGIVSGSAAGTTIITYSLGVGCTSTTLVTVVGLPAGISGSSSVCRGGTTTLTDATPGGTWNSSNTAIATISSTGVVTGVAGGSVTISYTATSGCPATKIMSVVAVPSVIGLHNICAWGDTLTIHDIITTGLFSSTLATVTNLGGGYCRLRGNAPGVANVTYTIPLGCSVTSTFTVNTLPGSITGSGRICSGNTLTLSDATPGGTWSSLNPTIATIGSLTGIVSGISGGTAYMRYRLTATGCKTDTLVVISSTPAAITGPSSLFIGTPITLSNSVPGGYWTSSNPSRATVVPTTGVVTGVSVGAVTISYTIGEICTVTKNLTVMPPRPGYRSTSVSSSNDGNEIHVFPNPGNGAFNLELQWDQDEYLAITITDATGSVIKEFTTITQKDQTTTVPFTLDVPSGIYLLSVNGTNTRQVLKIVVVN